MRSSAAFVVMAAVMAGLVALLVLSRPSTPSPGSTRMPTAVGPSAEALVSQQPTPGSRERSPRASDASPASAAVSTPSPTQLPSQPPVPCGDYTTTYDGLEPTIKNEPVGSHRTARSWATTRRRPCRPTLARSRRHSGGSTSGSRASTSGWRASSSARWSSANRRALRSSRWSPWAHRCSSCSAGARIDQGSLSAPRSPYRPRRHWERPAVPANQHRHWRPRRPGRP